MKRLIKTLLISALLVLGSLAHAIPGPLFKVISSGEPTSADVVLCLNGKAPLSCQNNHVSGQNLSISTTINRYYPFAGIKMLTPGYRPSGCTISPNGFCLFPAVAGTATSITVQKTTTSEYSVGGQVHGLLGTLVLENNGGDPITMTADGRFTFPTTLAEGSPYSVTVQSQPATQTCTVNQGSGIITNANVTNVTVMCSTNTHTVGGTVSGLAVAESVVLQNNGGDNLTIAANGGFVFSEPLAQGATYNVTVLTQPSTQTCTVSQGSGTIGATNVTNVQVTCATNAYTVGGTVTGLTGSMVLQNNGTDNLSVSANGPFTFSTPVAQGAPYSVTILTQPSGETCNVSNGSGTMGGANVNNVAVACLPSTTLSTSVSTLALSVTGLTEYGIPGTPSSGVARVITITNTGSATALGLTINEPTWPSGTSASHPSCGSTLSAGSSCTITITPGNIPTSDGTNPCSSGTAPVPGTVEVSASNANTVSTGVVILSYGCNYQGGYVFAFDDSTSSAQSVGGKVMATSDQASPFPSGIIWASRGTYNPSGDVDSADVSDDTLPGISNTSTTSSSNPTYNDFTTFFSTTYTNTPIPFSPGLFNACNGNLDGQCNTENILVFYNELITNYVYPGTSGPFTATAGPTTLTYYAAGLCKQTIATYSDWYLPAICEMGFDRTSQGSGCGSSTSPSLQNIQSSLLEPVSTPFSAPNGLYWSSTQDTTNPQTNAWRQEFLSGNSNQFPDVKYVRYGVRCVRILT